MQMKPTFPTEKRDDLEHGGRSSRSISAIRHSLERQLYFLQFLSSQ